MDGGRGREEEDDEESVELIVTFVVMLVYVCVLAAMLAVACWVVCRRCSHPLDLFIKNSFSNDREGVDEDCGLAIHPSCFPPAEGRGQRLALAVAAEDVVDASNGQSKRVKVTSV